MKKLRWSNKQTFLKFVLHAFAVPDVHVCLICLCYSTTWVWMCKWANSFKVSSAAFSWMLHLLKTSVLHKLGPTTSGGLIKQFHSCALLSHYLKLQWISFENNLYVFFLRLLTWSEVFWLGGDKANLASLDEADLVLGQIHYYFLLLVHLAVWQNQDQEVW